MNANWRSVLPHWLFDPRNRVVLAILLTITGTLQPTHAFRHLQEGGARSAWFDVSIKKPLLGQALAILLQLPEAPAFTRGTGENPAVRKVCLLEAGFQDQDAIELPTEVGVLPVAQNIVSQPSPEPIQRPRVGSRGIASARAPPVC